MTTTRLLHPPRRDADPLRARDPVVEGERHRLSPAQSLALWTRVCAEGRDVEQSWRRFHALAARVAPEVGRTTQVLSAEHTDDDLRRWQYADLRAPGRATRNAPVPGASVGAWDSAIDVERVAASVRVQLAQPSRGHAVRSLASHRHDARDRAQTSARALASPDARVRRAEIVRLDRSGELALALQRGAPGVVDAVASALRDGAIVAPHPVERWRLEVRELTATLASSGVAIDPRLTRWLGVPGARVASSMASGRAMADRDGATAPDVSERLANAPTVGGEPLSDTQRARMESLFGHRFAHVRIHTDDAAIGVAQAAGARAVAIGSHIYFNRGQFAPGTEAGDRLLLHELTHVVQHDLGALPASHGGVELSSPSDAAEHEARAMELRVSQLAPAGASLAVSPADVGSESRTSPATRDVPAGSRGSSEPRTSPASDAPTSGARASRNVLGDAWDWAGDKLDDIENWAEDKLESLVARVAPELVKLIKEGPGGLIKDAIQPAIASWVGSITGGLNVGKIAGQLTGSFSAAFQVLQSAKAGDPKCCETLIHGIEAIRGIAHVFIDNPVMNALKGVFEKVTDIVGSITKLVLAPMFDVLKSIVGGAWDAIQAVASKIQGWFNAVKRVAMRAFNWVAKKLGFASATGEGGLVDWLKQKAAEVWAKIKETLQPVIGPLKVIAGVLLMFTGLPQIYAIIKYGPQIVEAVKWLWANRNNPAAVKQNPGLIGGSILPKLLGVGQSFVGLVKSGASWLLEKTTALAMGAIQLLGGVMNVPLLSMATSFVKTLVDGVMAVQSWASGAFTTATTWLEGLYHRVVDFIKPYAEVLCSVALAITNPAMIPVILAGWAWQWLPDCIKPPLIDLLLDAVIAVLAKSPSLPMLGPLWPLLKSGILGFLGAVRGRDPQTKIKVSNKLAKIISGASPRFLLGFVKGLLKGVWDGIKMPFEAIYLIVKGIGKAGDFFVALGTDADAHARPGTASTAAPATAATPGTAQRPLPSTPSVITPDQATSVVSGIAAQLNAQKPPRPAMPAANGASPAGAPGGNDYQQLGQQAKRMAGALSGPSKTVATGFMPAIKSLFTGGKGMSLDDLIAKLGKVWAAAKHAVAQLGVKIANMIVDFLMEDSAEGDIGETIGYLVGMIAFQAVVDAFTVGAWSEISVVLTAIAKFLNWPMKFLGEAMGLMKKLGGFILDGVKSLGSLVAEAGAGALREVTGALREIAGKLGEFADEILAKFGNKGATAAERDAASAAERSTARTAERDAAGAAERDAAGAAERDAAGAERKGASAAEKEAMKAEELAEAIAVSKAIATAEDAGHVPGPAIAISLQGLRARYNWIKAYEAVPNAAGCEIFLIASRYSIIEARARINQLPEALQKRFSSLDDVTLQRLAELDDAALSKLAKLTDAELAQLAKLDEAALTKLTKLDDVALQDLVGRVRDPAQLQRLLEAVDKAQDLAKLLQHMSPGEIDQFLQKLGDPALFRKLADKYGGDVLQHYGPQFFKDFKGVDQGVLDHISKFDGLDKKTGIKGCHDEDVFLAELAQPPDGVAIPPPGAGRGKIISVTSNPADPAVKRYEYGFWKQDGKGKLVDPWETKNIVYAKTTIKDLAAQGDRWAQSAMEAVEEAIRGLRFPKGDASFSGTAKNGLKWTGWFRNGKIQTIFVEF